MPILIITALNITPDFADYLSVTGVLFFASHAEQYEHFLGHSGLSMSGILEGHRKNLDGIMESNGFEDIMDLYKAIAIR